MKQILMGIVLAVAEAAPRLTFAAGPAPVDLGTAGHFAILAGSEITTTGEGTVLGDVGLSPASGSFIGLPQPQVTGMIYAVDAAGPAGSIMTPALHGTVRWR